MIKTSQFKITKRKSVAGFLLIECLIGILGTVLLLLFIAKVQATIETEYRYAVGRLSAMQKMNTILYTFMSSGSNKQNKLPDDASINVQIQPARYSIKTDVYKPWMPQSLPVTAVDVLVKTNYETVQLYTAFLLKGS